MGKKSLSLVLLILSLSLVAAGIWREDVREVVSNATILCYSCIGLK